MNTKALQRLVVDFFMSALMILLMAYQVVPDAAHEIAGTAVGALFIVHAVLNRRWFSSFYLGRLTFCARCKTRSSSSCCLIRPSS